MFKSIREPGSALTHLAAMAMALIASVPLLTRAYSTSMLHFTAMAIFIISMILLYGASAAYHSVMVPAPVLKIYRKLDHMMISVLIAGSYTPVCLLVLDPPKGYILLAVIWGIAAAGMITKFFWITCPKWFSSALYIAMGWVCIFVVRDLFNMLSHTAFNWLLAGGLIYTAGGVIYALRLPIFNDRHRHFGSHEIFHLFVMGGSVCHYMVMFGLA